MAQSTTFSRQSQGDFIERHGTTLIHAVAVKCPCRNEDVFVSMGDDGADAVSVADHALCQNDRWLYRHPKEITGLLTSMNQQLTPVEMGWAQPGDVVFSPQLQDRGSGCEQRPIGQWDRLTSTIPQILDGGQVIVRGAGTAGANRGVTASAGLAENEDRLWYEPSSAVMCVDFLGNEYEPGDFVLGPGKKIVWVGRAPPPRRRYTLKYEGLLEWIAVLPPQERYDARENIGQKVLLRKMHVERLSQSARATTDSTMARSVV